MNLQECRGRPLYHLIYPRLVPYQDGDIELLLIPCDTLDGVYANMVQRNLAVSEAIVIHGQQVKLDHNAPELESRRAQQRREAEELEEARERAQYLRLKAKFEPA